MKKLFKNKNKLIISFCCVLFPAIMYGILGPLEIYAGNVKSFSISKWDILLAQGAATIVGLAIGTLLIYFIPDKISEWLCKLILSFSVVSYIQYLFLNEVLASDDGNELDWANLGGLKVKNTIIWIVLMLAIMAVLVIFKKYWDKIGVYVPVILTLIQTVAVISILITTPYVGREQYRLSCEGQFSLGNEENTIVLVLDGYGNQRFEKYSEMHPEVLSDFKDFTYYDNADSHYMGTYPSVASMWTQAEYDGEEEGKFFNEAWQDVKSENFFGKLKDNGWSFGLYGENQGNYFASLASAYGKIDNDVLEGITIRYKRILVRFTRESVFIFGPYIIKPYFEEITSNFKDTYIYAHPFSDRPVTLNRLLGENGFEILDDVPKRIIHLHTFGAHTIRNEEDLHYLDEAHEFVHNYLDELKRIGMYDNSTVIIMADHGCLWGWMSPDPQPMFMIKRSGETHSTMEINHAPISYDDMQGTILDIIDEPREDSVTSIYDWKDGDSRERYFYVPTSEKGYSYDGDREELLKKIGSE